MLRIGVIGSINRDTVTGPDGLVAHSLGGVLYTALAVGYLAGPQAEVRLLARLGADAQTEVLALLARHPCVRLDGVRLVSRPSYRCHIRYLPDGSKTEVLSGGVGSLQWSDLALHLADLDALLVNFITGFEVERHVLQEARARVRGPLVMDFHSLALGRRRSGERYARRPADWAAWVGLADAVQMNQEEAAVLGGAAALSEAQLATFAQRLLGLGPQAAAVTLGAAGALACGREGGRVRHVRVAADRPQAAVDPTGCGDVFLAAFGLALTRGVGLEAAVERACRAAGASSRVRGIDGMQSLAALADVPAERAAP